MRGRILLTVLMAATALPSVPSAEARTTVSIADTVVLLRVPVDVIGMADHSFRNPQTGERLDAAAAAREIGNRANALWNGYLADLRFRDCLTFQVDITLVPLPDGHAGSPGHHRVRYLSDPTANSWVRRPDGIPGVDRPGVYSTSAEGAWRVGQGEKLVAHEAGHLLGLGDDYSKPDGVYVPKPGREGTLMAHPTGIVDQNIVDRLGKLLEEAGIDLPECWVGTMYGEWTLISRYDPDVSHFTMTTEAEFEFMLHLPSVDGYRYGFFGGNPRYDEPGARLLSASFVYTSNVGTCDYGAPLTDEYSWRGLVREVTDGLDFSAFGPDHIQFPPHPDPTCPDLWARWDGVLIGLEWFQDWRDEYGLHVGIGPDGQGTLVLEYSGPWNGDLCGGNSCELHSDFTFTFQRIGDG